MTKQTKPTRMWPHALLAVSCSAMLLACAGTPTRESTGAAIDDSGITARIKAALVADPQTRAREIHVRTYQGVVELSGFVASGAESADAERIAMHEPGVRSVKDELQLTPAGARTVASVTDDSDLTLRVKAALVANPDTKAHQINVRTRHAVVQLSGFVDSSEEREAAVQVANGVQGVEGVEDGLQVKPSE